MNASTIYIVALSFCENNRNFGRHVPKNTSSTANAVPLPQWGRYLIRQKDREFCVLCPFAFTSTDLIKDIFSCKAKSRPCHPERSRTAKQCEAKPSRISGGNIILSPRRSRCCASPYGFDCGRRMRLPPFRMTRGRYITFREIEKSFAAICFLHPCIKRGASLSSPQSPWLYRS